MRNKVIVLQIINNRKTMLSNTVHNYWSSIMMSGKIIYIDELFTLVINASLEESHQMMMLEMPNKHTLTVVSHRIAELLSLTTVNEFSEEIFRKLLTDNEVLIDTPVEVFYFSENEKIRLAKETVLSDIRQLIAIDRPYIEKFVEKLSKEELSVSEVDLESSFLFGAFEKGELVCVASGTSWFDSIFTDVRVITMQTHRELGIATNVVCALSQSVIAAEGELQFRCSINSDATLGLADALELTPFGKLEVANF